MNYSSQESASVSKFNNYFSQKIYVLEVWKIKVLILQFSLYP